MSSRSRTIAIVGAGFSGTALAYRLLRGAHATPTRVVLIERADSFGCGLAYSERAAGTTAAPAPAPAAPFRRILS